MRLHVMAMVLLSVGVASRAEAQPTAPGGRVGISLNAGVQPIGTSFGSATSQPVHLEQSVVDTAYKVRNGVLVDGGVRYRIAGAFGLGAAVSWMSKSDDAEVDAKLPHPFFFGTPRSITGTATDLKREELVAHLQASYSIRPSPRLEVTFAGGPSFFRVTQGFVVDVAYTDTYPYDAPAFTSATTTRVHGNKTGFNAGVDLGMRVSRHAGLGGLVRYSHAEVPFDVPGSGTTVTSNAGGVQVGGGVRIYF